MKGIILPNDCNVLEEVDVKKIEGGCLSSILPALTATGTSGEMSLNDLFSLMSLAMNFFNALSGGSGLDSLVSGLLGSSSSNLLGLVSSTIPTTNSVSSTSISTSC